MRVDGDKSNGHLKTRQSDCETPAVPSCDDPQVKEEEFESLFSTSPVHFDNIGDDESGDHPLQTSQTTSSLQPSTISRPPSHLDREDVTEVQKILKRNVELDRRLKEEKTAREELVSENDRLHKAQLQLQEQNRKLQAKLRDLQEQYEEKCRQLRECEKQHPQHPQQERLKQEHVDDDAAELQQPLQLQAWQRPENDAISNAITDAEVVSDEHAKQEAFVGDEADDVEEAGEAEGIKSTDGEADDIDAGEVAEEDGSESTDGEEDEDVCGSGSEEENSDDRPSKR
jgi:hypothetical protein